VGLVASGALPPEAHAAERVLADRSLSASARYLQSVRPGTTIAIVALLVMILGAAILQFVFKVGG